MFAVSHRATDRGINARSVPQVTEAAPKSEPARVIDLEAEAERRRIAEIEVRRAEGIRQFRRWGMPDWALAILTEVADSHAICPSDIGSRKRWRPIIEARREAIYRIKAKKPVLHCTVIGKWFNKDHTTINHHIACYQMDHGAPRLIGYDLAKVRARNAQTSARMREQAKQS